MESKTAVLEVKPEVNLVPAIAESVLNGTAAVPPVHESTESESSESTALAWPETHEELEKVLNDLALNQPFATKDIRPVFGMRPEWGMSEVGVIVPEDATIQEVYDFAAAMGKGGNFVQFASGDLAIWLIEYKGLSVETVAGMFGTEVKTIDARMLTCKRIPIEHRILFSGFSASASPVTYEHQYIASQTFIDAEKAEGERAGLPDTTILRHCLNRLKAYKDRRVKDVNGIVQKVPETREWRVECQRYIQAYKEVTRKESLEFLLDEHGKTREEGGKSLSARNAVVSAMFGILDSGSISQSVAKVLTSDQVGVIQTVITEINGKNPTAADRAKQIAAKKEEKRKHDSDKSLPDGSDVRKEQESQEPETNAGKVALVVRSDSAANLLEEFKGDRRLAEVNLEVMVATVMEYLLNRRAMTPEQFNKKGLTQKFIQRINSLPDTWVKADTGK